MEYPKGHKSLLKISSYKPFFHSIYFQKGTSREPRTRVSLKYYMLSAIFAMDISHLSIKTNAYHFFKTTGNVCHLTNKKVSGENIFSYICNIDVPK